MGIWEVGGKKVVKERSRCGFLSAGRRGCGGTSLVKTSIQGCKNYEVFFIAAMVFDMYMSVIRWGRESGMNSSEVTETKASTLNIDITFDHHCSHVSLSTPFSHWI